MLQERLRNARPAIAPGHVMFIACAIAIEAPAAQETRPAQPPTSTSSPATTSPTLPHELELAWRLDLPPNRLAGGTAFDPEKGVAYVLAPANKVPEFKRCLEIGGEGKVE